MNDFNLVQPSGTFDTPNYGGGGGAADWFQENSVGLLGSLGSLFGGVLTGTAAIIGAQNGQYVPPVNNNTNTNQKAAPTQAQGTNWMVWLIIAIVIVVIVAALYFLTKQTAA